MSDYRPPAKTISASMARWMADGWSGRAPLHAIFWGGGAVWFFGYLVERGIVHLFMLPQSPYAVHISQSMALLLRASEWVLLGVFIWWCVSVWRCADRDAMGVWPTTAKGVVALMVIANAITAMMAMS